MMSDSEDDMYFASTIGGDRSAADRNGADKKVLVAVRMRPKKTTGPERYDSSCVRLEHGMDLGASIGCSTRESNASDRQPSFSSAMGVSPAKSSPLGANTASSQPTVTIADPEGKVDALSFAFDKVFDETDDQETIYQEVAHGPVVAALESGGDALFVAYGQTGSGKTYTMLGEDARYVPHTPSSSASLTPTSCPLGATLRGGRGANDPLLASPGKALGGTTYFAGGDEGLRLEVDAGAGVLMRVMNAVLQYKERREGPDKQWHVVVAMSAVEVYNDSLFDLLAANGGARANIKSGPNARNVELDVREFGDDLFITNLQRFVITSTSHVQSVFEIALRNRSVAPTQMNDTSSRSHAIFTAEVFLQRRTGANPDPPDPGLMAEHLISSSFNSNTVARSGRSSAASVAAASAACAANTGNPSNDFCLFPFTASRITMVDLAGNERVKKSGVSGKELNEAVAVNKSLSALGHVVHQICQGSKHISFRDSKVTRLLRSSFSSPRSRIVFIANISPTGQSYPETTCSLRFVARLKELKPIVTSTATLQQQTASALKEDQMLQRLHVFEQLCGDFRILRDGYHYKPQVARWRRSTGNNKLTAKGAASRYSDEVKDLQETRKVLELEQLVQEFAASIRLSTSTQTPDDDGGNQYGRVNSTASSVGLGGGGAGSEHANALRRELDEITTANADVMEELASIQKDLARLQEQANAANRLLGVRGDTERKLAAIAKEAAALDAQVVAVNDPRRSEYGVALEALAQEKEAMARDEAINAANAQFATKLLEHNRSKIAVRAERIEQLSLRNTIDATQQTIMGLYHSNHMKRVRVPVTALANSDALDMRKVLEICSTMRNPAAMPLREDQLIEGPEALEKCMAARMAKARTMVSGNVSPLEYYISPSSAAQLSRYLAEQNKSSKGGGGSSEANRSSSAAHLRAPSIAPNNPWDSDGSVGGDEGALSGPDGRKGSTPAELFEALPMARREALGDALRLCFIHGQIMALLDTIHVTRLVDSRRLRLLFARLDKVPIDGLAADTIVACARRNQGGSGDDSSDWSGDELESNLGSSASVYRLRRDAADGSSNKGRDSRVSSVKSSGVSDHTRRVIKKLLEDPSNTSNAALIRCIQAHSLFGRMDALCEPLPVGPQSVLHGLVYEVRRRAMLRQMLDVQATPLAGEPAAKRGEGRAPSADVVPDDALSAFARKVLSPEALADGVPDEEAMTSHSIDRYLCYLSPYSCVAASQLLPRIVPTDRAPPSTFPHRDLSLITFYGSKIIDTTNLMAPAGAEQADVIPYMPSTVRFTEVMLMCCGYAR